MFEYSSSVILKDKSNWPKSLTAIALSLGICVWEFFQAYSIDSYELEFILSPTLRLISSSVVVGGRHVSLHACQSIIALKL